MTVSWARPSPGGSAVTVKTVLYRQFAGPQIVDFTVAPWDAENEWITDSTVAAHGDYQRRRPGLHGAGDGRWGHPHGLRAVHDHLGERRRHPHDHSALQLGQSRPVYEATWLVPGGAGISDGYWTFKAVAFSAQKYPGNSWEFAKRVESGPAATVTDLTATPGDTWVSLTWSPSVSNDLAYYEVYRGRTGTAATAR